MPLNTSLTDGSVGVMETAIPGYKPWEQMSNAEKNVCISEVVLEWEKYIDVETKSVRWVKRRAYGEEIASKDWPPNYMLDGRTSEEIERHFDHWELQKIAPRHYIATVYAMIGDLEKPYTASGVTKYDAFNHAAVLAKGACV